MAEQTKTIQKQEAKRKEGIERTRDRMTFMPRTDIYERENDYVLIAEMPGVDHDAVDINFDNNELTITGHVDERPIEGHSISYSEYEVGDYQRSFRFSGDVDIDKIDAKMANGVLRLILPKNEESKPKKITVKSG